MYMKAFLVFLEQVAKKDYPDIEFQFYLSRRSKFTHMGLDVPLISIENHVKLVKFIQDYWEQIKSDDMFSFCTPRLISATKFKFDYIIFFRPFLFITWSVQIISCSILILFLEFKVPNDFVKEANFVSAPTHQTSSSVGNDLFSTKKYSLSQLRPTLVNCGLSVRIPEG